VHYLTARPLPRFALFLIALTIGAQAQTYTVIHNFTGGQDGAQPAAGPALDRFGNLFGTSFSGGQGSGTVYKLSR